MHQSTIIAQLLDARPRHGPQAINTFDQVDREDFFFCDIPFAFCPLGEEEIEAELALGALGGRLAEDRRNLSRGEGDAPRRELSLLCPELFADTGAALGVRSNTENNEVPAARKKSAAEVAGPSAAGVAPAGS